MRMKLKEQEKAIQRKRCPGTGKANPQNRGISGKKMHLAIVRKHFGEVMLLLPSIHGPKRLQDGTMKEILMTR